MTTERQTETLLRFCALATTKDLKAALVHARTGWLKDWLTEHLPEIINLGNSPDDIDRYIEWDLKAKEMMAGRGLEKPEQQKNRLTDIRNAIKSIDPEHPVLKYVGFTKEEWEKINRAGDDAVSKRPTLFIENPIAIVERAEELLNSRDWYDLAAGLAVLTGRRCAEVMKTAVFEYKTPYSVTFTGAVKRKEETVPLVFEIPTLTRAEKIIAAIAKLRAWMPTEGMTKIEVNNHYAGAIIKSCDRHFTGLVPPREDEDGKDNNLYTHLFRAVYATIAAHWFCPPRVPEGEFKAYIQGHFQVTNENDPTLRNNISSGRHYSDYVIGDGNGNRNGRLGIRLGEPDVVVVEAFQSFYRLDISEKTGTPDNVEGTGNRETSGASEKGTMTSIATGTLETTVTASEAPPEAGRATLSPRKKPARPRKSGTDGKDTTAGASTAIEKTNPPTDTATDSLQLPLPLPDVAIVPIPDIQEILGWMLNSRQYTVLLVGLMTVTGKSPGELIKSGFFKLDLERPALTFSPTSVTRKPAPLPTLLPPDVTLGAIERLRNHPKVKDLRYRSPNDIDRLCLRRLGRALHLYLPFKDIDELFDYYRSEVARSPGATVIPPVEGEGSVAVGAPESASDTTAPTTATSGAICTETPEVPVRLRRTDGERGMGIERTENEPDAVETSDTNALQWAGVAREIAASLGIDDPGTFRAWIEKQLHPDTDTSPATDNGEGVSEPDSPPNVEPDTIPDEPDSPLAKGAPTASALEAAPAAIDPPEPAVGANTSEPMTLERMFLAQQRSLSELTGAIFQLVNSLASSPPRSDRNRANPRERVPPDNSQTTDATGPLAHSGNAPRERRSSPGRPPNEALVNRAIDSIINHNDSVATTKKDKWLISLSVLKQLTRCNQEVIARVMERRKDEIDRHHALHELGTFHNSKGKFAPKITKVIRLE